MESGQVQWGPAVAVLLVGLVLGALLVRRAWRRAGAAPPTEPSLVLRDLDRRVESLVCQLRELEDMAAKRTPEQLARERYALELEAARACVERETLAAPATKARKRSKAGAGAAERADLGGVDRSRDAATGEAAGAPRSRAGLRGFLWGAASVGALVTLAFLAGRGVQPRPKGGSVTGSTPREAGPGAGGEAIADDARLRAMLARNPDDFDSRLDLARVLVARRDLMGVWNETQYVLERSPGHPRALAYQALARLGMGEGDEAVSLLQQALAAAPDLLEAHQHLVFVYASLGRTAEAETAIAEADRRFPGAGAELQRALTRFRQGLPKAAR